MSQVITLDQFRDVCLELAKLYLAGNEAERASSWNALPVDIQQQLLTNVQDLTQDSSCNEANILQKPLKEAILQVYGSFKIKIGSCRQEDDSEEGLQLRKWETLEQSPRLQSMIPKFEGSKYS